MKGIPLVIESDIYVQSLDQKENKARSRVLGARHGDFILIEQPIVCINARLSIPIHGELVCSLFHDGDLYWFRSRTLQSPRDGLTFIAYPDPFHRESFRKHHRIRVNIETRLAFESIREQATGTLKDISEGGCLVTVPTLLHVTQHMECTLQFCLPDQQMVTGLMAKIRNIQFSSLRKETSLGLQFLGNGENILKIAAFCRYCTFFKI